MFAYLIKRDKVYYQSRIHVGLKYHNHYTDDIFSAKWIETWEEASRLRKVLNEENVASHLRGRWNVIEYEWREIE